MMTDRRRLLIACYGGATPPLPYQLVSYIKSSGTQYIQTDVFPTGDLEFEIHLFLDEIGSPGDNASATVFGETQSNKMLELSTYRNGTLQYYNGNNQFRGMGKHVEYTVRFEGGKIYLNGTQVGTRTITTFSATLALLMFAKRNANNSISGYLSGGIYYATFWKAGGSTVADFRAAKDIATNKGGLQELVSGTFYGNDGTGDFVIGPDLSAVAQFVTNVTPMRLPSITLSGAKQGACTDGTYIYQFNYGNCSGIKYKISDGTYTVTSLSPSSLYDHGNDMCYNPNNNHIYLAAMSNDGAVIEMDTDWTYVATHYLEDGNGSPYPVWGLAFDRNTNHFLSEYGNTLIIVYDQSLNYLSSYAVPDIPAATGQGFETDGDFLYRVCSSPDILNILTMDGRYAKTIDILNIGEPETLMYDWNGHYYLNENAGSGFLYEAEIKQ